MTVKAIILEDSASVILTVFVFSVAINVLALTSPLYMLQVYDRVLASGSIETLIYISLVAAAALLAFALLEGTRARLLARVGARFHNAMMTLMLRRTVFSAALAFVPSRPPSDRDVDQVRGFVAGAPITAFLDFPWIAIFLGVLYLLHPLFFYSTTLAALVLLLLALVSDVSTRGRVSQAAVAAHAADVMLSGARRNAELVEGMGMRAALERRWRLAQDEAVAGQIEAQDRESRVGAMSKFIRLALQSAMLGLGAWLVIRGQATPGVMIAASIISARALAPIDIAIGSWKSFVGARAAAGRLDAFLAASAERPESQELPPPRGVVQVEAATLHFPNSPAPVLRGITFTVEPGQALAIIGPSAAGKSSLLRLIAGVWVPTQGAVRIDGATAFTWPRAQLGRHIGVLPQEVGLFPGSVAENIARMQDPDPQAVVTAARKAGVHDLILRLPMGYGTQVGDQGMQLSGGYRQRIGLARALYCEPVLLLLDEPNSHLDQEGEEALASCITSLVESGRTVIIVAHRPSVLDAVTHVAVMHDGQLTDIGPRDHVLERIRGMPRAVNSSRTGEVVTDAALSGAGGSTAKKPNRSAQYSLRPVVLSSNERDKKTT